MVGVILSPSTILCLQQQAQLDRLERMNFQEFGSFDVKDQFVMWEGEKGSISQWEHSEIAKKNTRCLLQSWFSGKWAVVER